MFIKMVLFDVAAFWLANCLPCEMVTHKMGVQQICVEFSIVLIALSLNSVVTEMCPQTVKIEPKWSGISVWIN